MLPYLLHLEDSTAIVALTLFEVRLFSTIALLFLVVGNLVIASSQSQSEPLG